MLGMPEFELYIAQPEVHPELWRALPVKEKKSEWRVESTIRR